MNTEKRTINQGLSADTRKLLKSTVVRLRQLLEDNIGRELRRIGIDPSRGKPIPCDDLSYLSDADRKAREALDAALTKEMEKTESYRTAVEALRREAAYTHLNRLVGLKCIELRGLLELEGDQTEAVTCRHEFGDRSKWLWTLRDRQAKYRYGEDAEELLWREGLDAVYKTISPELGVLFDPDDPYAQVWPSHRTLKDTVVELNELPEEAYRADEFLGWVYQYFQTDEKDRVFEEARTKSKKISGADIIPVTSLYTERYMVDFLLQNSIGAHWMEMYPDSKAKESWPYYVEPATPHTRTPQPVKEWTVLDPCVGSGHFLVVAFDMLVRLYTEECMMAEEGRIPKNWAVSEDHVARTILEKNLHGIDIDLRSVQLAVLALYIKAKEHGLKVEDGAPAINLVAADAVLSRGEAYDAIIVQYEGDSAVREAIEAIWSALENVYELGSLVRVEEEVDAAVRKVKEKEDKEAPLLSSARDWEAYKRKIIESIRDAFEAETQNGDVYDRIFKAEGKKGIGLVELLSKRYDIVCTNPPYMGSKNMGSPLKKYISSHYEMAKRDLYAAFILRCLELVEEEGLVSMVTLQSWLAKDSYISMRAALLKDIVFRCLYVLGRYAFSEGDPPGIPVLFVLGDYRPSQSTRIWIGETGQAMNASAQAAKLQSEVKSKSSLGDVDPLQHQFAQLAKKQFLLGTTSKLLSLLAEDLSLSKEVVLCEPTTTGDNLRFVHFVWEHPNNRKWRIMAKGGRHLRWSGLEIYLLNWGKEGSEIKQLSGSYIRNEVWMFRPGLTFTAMSRHGISFRIMPEGMTFGKAGPGIFPPESKQLAYLSVLNSRLYGFLLRRLNPGASISLGNIGQLPSISQDLVDNITCIAEARLSMSRILNSLDLREYSYLGVDRFLRDEGWREITDDNSKPPFYVAAHIELLASTVMATIDGLIEDQICEMFELDQESRSRIIEFLGAPPGWLPILSGYDSLPNLELKPLDHPNEVKKFAEDLDHVNRSAEEIELIKRSVRKICINGSGADIEEDGIDIGYTKDEEKLFILNSAIRPLPPESHIEDIALRLGIHPISARCILLELEQEDGFVSPSVLQHHTEIYFITKILQMLGHFWPMHTEYEQEAVNSLIEAKWVDEDGTIPLAPGTGEETLIERIQRFLDEEFGPERGPEVEKEAEMILGWRRGYEWGKQKPIMLVSWLEKEFFQNHVSQFKKRPIAWHLTSERGTFQAIVYYHKFNTDRLRLLRARYVRQSLETIRRQLGKARASEQDRQSLALIDDLETKIKDVEDFDQRLGLLLEGRDRGARIWCPWKEPTQQPVGWDPDINDGVRVNIAPVQRLGLLAADVLTKKDLKSLLAPSRRE